MKEENMIDINSILNNDDFAPVKEIEDIKPIKEEKLEEDLKKEDIISIDEIVEESKINEEEKLKRIKEMESDKKIERVQIGLILFLVVVGTLVYFFGYDLFEPYIKID